MGDTPINLGTILEQARDWTFDGDFQLLQWMNKLSQNLEARATKTAKNLDRLNNNVKSTHAALDNVANSLTALQYGNQFVECRVQDDDETLLGGGNEGVTNGISESVKPTSKEMLRTFLDNNLKLLRNCHEKYSVQLDDSDDEDERSEKTCIFQPINPYNDKPLPHIFGSKEWSEKWHVGLSYDDQENDYSGEELSEACSESSSSSAAADNDSYETNSEFASSVSLNNENVNTHNLERNVRTLRRSKIEEVSESSSTHSSAAKISTHKLQSHGLLEGLQAGSSSLSSLHSKPEDTVSKSKKETNASVSVGKSVAGRPNIPPYIDLFAEPPEDLGSTSSTPSLVNHIGQRSGNFFSDDDDGVYKHLVIAQSKKDDPPTAIERTTTMAKTSPTVETKTTTNVEVSPPMTLSNEKPKKSATASFSSISKTPKSLFDDDDDDDFLSAFVRKQESLGNQKLLGDPIGHQNANINKANTINNTGQKNKTMSKDNIATSSSSKSIHGKNHNSEPEKQWEIENAPRKTVNLFDDVEDMDYDIFNKTPSNMTRTLAEVKQTSTEPKASDNNMPTRSLSKIIKSTNLFDDDDDDDDDFFKTLPSIRNLSSNKVISKDEIKSSSSIISTTSTVEEKSGKNGDEIFKSLASTEGSQIVKIDEFKPSSETTEVVEKITQNVDVDLFKTPPLVGSDDAGQTSKGDKLKTSHLLPVEASNILASDDDDDDDDRNFFETLSSKKSSASQQIFNAGKETDQLLNEFTKKQDQHDGGNFVHSSLHSNRDHLPKQTTGESEVHTWSDLLSKDDSARKLNANGNEDAFKDISPNEKSKQQVLEYENEAKKDYNLNKNTTTPTDSTTNQSETVISITKDSHNLQANVLPNTNKMAGTPAEKTRKNILEHVDSPNPDTKNEDLLSKDLKPHEKLSTSTEDQICLLNSAAKIKPTQIDEVNIESESVNDTNKKQSNHLEQIVNITANESSPLKDEITSEELTPIVFTTNITQGERKLAKESSPLKHEIRSEELVPIVSTKNITQGEKKSQNYDFNSSLLFDEPPDDDDNEFFESLGKSSQQSNAKFNSFDLENDLYPELQLPKKSAAETSSLAYAGLQLFNDIPPEDDGFNEVMIQPSESTRRLNTVFYDDFSETLEALNRNQKANLTHSILNNEPPPDIKEGYEPKLDISNKDVVENLQIINKSKTESKSLSIETSIVDKLQEEYAKDASKSSSTHRTVAKLQRPNININVQALLPVMGDISSRPKKSQNPENKENNRDELLAQERPIVATGDESRRTAETEHILPSINKTRVKAPANRRPSTRKARRESYRKSLLEEQIFNEKVDIYADNEEGNLKEKQTVPVGSKHREATKSQLENTTKPLLNIADTFQQVKSPASNIFAGNTSIRSSKDNERDDSKLTFNPKTNSTKKSTFFDEDDEIGHNDNGLFKVASSNKENVIEKQTSVLSPEEEDKQFITETTRNSQSVINIQSTEKATGPFSVDTSSEKSQKSLPNNTKTMNKTKPSPKMLFTDSESDDDLFSKLPSTKPKVLELKQDKTNTTVINKPPDTSKTITSKPHTSLFSDDSDEEDFLKTPVHNKLVMKTKAKSGPNAKSIFSDIEDSDDGELFGSSRKVTITQTSNMTVPTVAETNPSNKQTVADNPLADLL